MILKRGPTFRALALRQSESLYEDYSSGELVGGLADKLRRFPLNKIR